MKNFANLFFVAGISFFAFTNCGKSGMKAAKAEVDSLTLSNIGRNSVFCSAVVKVQNAAIVARGFCADTLDNPDLSHARFVIKVTGNTVADSITGLLYGRTYYVRAWTITNKDTVYSGSLSFRTLDAITKLSANFQGGTVFYLDSTGNHGLIMAPKDAGRFIWSNNWDKIYITDTTQHGLIGQGRYYTQAIIKADSSYVPCTYCIPPSTTAAAACHYYSYGGYSDWYLPSFWEFRQLSTWNLHYAILGVNALSIDFYWTSSEGGPYQAYFDGGSDASTDGTYLSDKSEYWAVRPIRSF